MTPSQKSDLTTNQLLDMRSTLEQALEGADEESATSLEEAIGSLDDQLADKIDALVYVARMAEARAKAINEEALHMKRMAERELAKSVRVKDFLKYVGEVLGTSTLVGKTRKASICQNGGMRFMRWTTESGGKPDVMDVPPKLVSLVPDLARIEADMAEGKLPPDYVTTIVDTAKVREALESGEELPFAKLDERGNHVRLS